MHQEFPQDHNTITFEDKKYLQIMLEEAAKKGAIEALKEIGLSDDNAPEDIRDLRNLLESYKAAKQTIQQTIIKAVTWALIGAATAGVMIKLNLEKLTGQ